MCHDPCVNAILFFNAQPRHPGTLPIGTLRAIIRQTGLSVDEFLGY
jgi:hypothetical protein